MTSIPTLTDVALLADLPERRLARGCVGTVVEQLDADTYAVEFSDDEGRAYAMAALHGDPLLPLLHAPASHAA